MRTKTYFLNDIGEDVLFRFVVANVKSPARAVMAKFDAWIEQANNNANGWNHAQTKSIEISQFATFSKRPEVLNLDNDAYWYATEEDDGEGEGEDFTTADWVTLSALADLPLPTNNEEADAISDVLSKRLMGIPKD